MSNAICKSLAIALAAITLTACSGKKSGSDDNADNRSRANELVEAARIQLESGDPQECINMLDKLRTDYPDQTDLVRNSIPMRYAALESIIMAQIDADKEAFQGLKAENDSLMGLMTNASVMGLNGWFIATKSFDPKFTNSTGLSGRVDEFGNFVLVSSLNPAKGVNHISVTAIAGDATATTDTVPHDQAMNIRMDGREMITFTASHCDSIGRFITEHRTEPITVRYNGESGRSNTRSLTIREVDGIATAWLMAQCAARMKQTLDEIQTLSNKLIDVQAKIQSLSQQ